MMNIFFGSRSLYGIIVITSCCLLGASPARGQHPDVLPYISAGQLTTGGFDDGDGTLTQNLRVFNFVFGEDDPMQPFFAGDPGFRADFGGFTPGKHLHFDILSGAAFGLPSTLAYWDGAGVPHFGPTPDSESLTLQGVLAATAGSGNAQVPGFNIGTFDSAGGLHVHLSSTLNGSAGNEPASGIYLVSLGLTTDMPGVSPAKPIFIVYNSGLSDEQLGSAVNFVQSSFVPEPSAVLLACLGSAGLLLPICRHRGRR